MVHSELHNLLIRRLRHIIIKYRKLMLAHYKDKIALIVTYLIFIVLFLLFKLNTTKLIIASAVIICLIICIKKTKNNLLLNRSDLLINFLLLGFSTSYYIISWANGYINLERGIQGILSIQALYLLGHYSFLIFKQKDNNLKVIIPVISIALGFSVYFFAAILIASIDSKSFFIYSRYIKSLWANQKILATVVAIYSSMGIALLPLGVKLLRHPNKTKLNILLILTIFFMGATSLISSFMLSNRSTFSLLIIILFLFICYILYLNYMKNGISWIKCLLLISILFITMYLIFFQIDFSFLNQFEIPLFQRFAKNNTGDARLNLWAISIKNLSTNFWGGKTYPLIIPKSTGASLPYFKFFMKYTNFLHPNYYQGIYYIPATYFFPYIHNLWLDIHYESGILPFCFLITFHLAHLKSLLSLILNTKRQIIAITVLGIVAVTFFYFMIEPAFTASNKFFMASCFLLAYFRQISKFSFKDSLEEEASA